MNRFSELLDDLRRRHGGGVGNTDVEDTVTEAVKEEAAKKDQRSLRLPYSSDPPPLEEPWR